jgi:hypothetical protein
VQSGCARNSGVKYTLVLKTQKVIIAQGGTATNAGANGIGKITRPPTNKKRSVTARKEQTPKKKLRLRNRSLFSRYTEAIAKGSAALDQRFTNVYKRKGKWPGSSMFPPSYESLIGIKSTEYASIDGMKMMYRKTSHRNCSHVTSVVRSFLTSAKEYSGGPKTISYASIMTFSRRSSFDMLFIISRKLAS